MALHRSIWADVAMPQFPPLQENIHADVCVIGAGIAGLTTAYLLAKAGRHVVVLDDGPVGGRHDERDHRAPHQHASTTAISSSRSCTARRRAPRGRQPHRGDRPHRDDRHARKRIDCDFQRLDGYLFLAAGDKRETLERELDAARRAGLRDVEPGRARAVQLVRHRALPALPAPGRSSIRSSTSRGLARGDRAARRPHLLRHARRQRRRRRRPRVVQAGQHVVTADAVVVATNVPINDRVAIHTKQAPYMTYVVARARAAGRGAAGAVLGHGRSVPLRPHASRAGR